MIFVKISEFHDAVGPNTVVSPKSKITDRRTKTDWIDGRTDWMNEYRIYNPILVSSPGLLSLR